VEALSGRVNPSSERETNTPPLPKDITRLDFCLDDNRVVGYAQLHNIKGSEWAVVPHQALILGKAPGLGGADDTLEPNHHQETESGLPNVLQALTKAECGSAFVFWQQEKGLLWLGSDRYGLKPFYYYHHRNEFAFSTDLQWLVQTSNRKFSVNYSVLSQFLCLRHPFGDETLFRSIRRLSQGELLCYSVQEDKLQTVPFFTYLSLRPVPGVTFKQVLAEAPARFTAALERQLNGASKVVLPLSGGYDSRMIACGLHRLGVELLTYTTHKDYGSTTDTVAAAAVAALLGTTHHNIPLPISYFARFHQQKCRLVQFETSYHPWIVNLLSSMPEEPLPCFDGLGGDACLGCTEVTPRFWELWRKKQYKLFENIYLQWYKTGFESLVRPKYHREIIALARQEVVAEIDRIKGNPNGLIYLGLRNFTRRAISLSTFGILGHNRPVRTPFLDHEFFE